MKILSNLIERFRSSGPEAALAPSGAWHIYEDRHGSRIRVYNHSPGDMPREMLFRGIYFAHIAPFSGEVNEQPTFAPGDLCYRHLTQSERREMVEKRIKAMKKAGSKHGYRILRDPELRHQLNGTLAKERYIFEVQAIRGTEMRTEMKSVGSPR